MDNLAFPGRNRLTRTAWLLLWLLVRATMTPSLADWVVAYLDEPSKWLILRFRDAALQRLTIAMAYTSGDLQEAAWRAYPGTKTKKLDVWHAVLSAYDIELAEHLLSITLEDLEHEICGLHW